MERAIGHPVRSCLSSVSTITNTCIVFPLIYHSIADEIPSDSQPLITRLYQLWLVLIATLIINAVACLLLLLAGTSDGGKDFGASMGCVQSLMSSMLFLTRGPSYIFVIGALSFLLWYRWAILPSPYFFPADYFSVQDQSIMAT
jgi:hypothetical protein